MWAHAIIFHIINTSNGFQYSEQWTTNIPTVVELHPVKNNVKCPRFDIVLTPCCLVVIFCAQSTARNLNCRARIPWYVGYSLQPDRTERTAVKDTNILFIC